MNFASFSLRRALCGYWKAGDVPAERSRGRTAFGRFAGDLRGDVAILFGLMTLVLVMLIGLAVDYGRLVNARSQTLEATDAAVLAGARALQTNGGDQAAAIKVAQAFYNQAVQSRIPVVSKSDTINFAITDSGTAVISNGNAKISTPFMSVAGVKTLSLLHADGSDYAKAVLAVGGNAELNLEVSMMLDITGSMKGQKLTDMKAAASDLVNIVVWKDQSQVYVEDRNRSVRLRCPSAGCGFQEGDGYNDDNVSLCRGAHRDAKIYRRGSAVGAVRDGAQQCASTKNNKTTYSPTCDVATAAELLPLTSDKTSLLAKISGLATAGSTAGHIGTAWAWYMLAPNWSSLWASSSTPAAYGTDKLKKIAVLMTDGEYNTQYTTNGVPDDFELAHQMSECGERRVLERTGCRPVHSDESQGYRGLYGRFSARQFNSDQHASELCDRYQSLLQLDDRRCA